MTTPPTLIQELSGQRLSVQYSGESISCPDGLNGLLHVAFGAAESGIAVTSAGLSIYAPLPNLSSSGGSEIWQTPVTVRSGMDTHLNDTHLKDSDLKDSDLGYACTDSWMVVGLVAAETSDKPLAEVAELTYRRILRFVEAEGYPYLYRMWNYFPSIHAMDSPLELDRYQAFCMGRYHAFAERAEFEISLPAASALGSHGKGLLVYAIAGRTPAVQIENPYQVSAFRYPSVYGPKSPSFSRAMIVPGKDSVALFISGTASIRGHESVFIDDIEGQITRTLWNIRSLLTHAHISQSAPIDRIEDLAQLKIYLRHPEHRSQVERILNESLSRVPPTVILQSDICRSELLVEIEGLYLT